MKFITFIKDTADNYKHSFSSKNEKYSKSVICFETPLKKFTIEKHFENEEDLNIIKESLLEQPEVYEFDQVYRSAR